MSGAPARVVVGRLGRPHGVGGMMYARSTGPTLATLGVGDSVWVRADGTDAEHRLAEVAGTPDRLRLRLEGVATRDAAAALTGAELLVPESRLAPIDRPDTFYVSDLIGCAVLAGASRLGEVRQVHAAPANDVLEVAGDGEPVLIPFTADAVVELDVPGRRIVIRADLLG